MKPPVIALACLVTCAVAARSQVNQSVEEIHVVRTWREGRMAPTAFCAESRIGFAAEIEDTTTLRAVQTRADGRVVSDDARIVGGLRACFATVSATVSRYYARGRLGQISFTGRGECALTRQGFPEPGMSVGLCFLDLSDLPAAYAGGALTTNTVNSQTLIGGESRPPGYTQPAIATIRLWKTRPITACTMTPPAGTSRMRPADIAMLTGEFEVTLLTTSGAIERPGAPLTLRLADSAERAVAGQRRIGFTQRTALQLTGRVENQPAEVDDGVLYLGCRDCTDASPSVLEITRVSRAGFWGTWRDFQTGIGVAVDARGARLPDPAGRFCAIRRGAR